MLLNVNTTPKLGWCEEQSHATWTTPSDLLEQGPMDDAALSAMHADLSNAEAARGHHGGLGFERGAGGGSGDKASNTAASKALLNSGSRGSRADGRSYQATSAGAVAAGHWDPWARPVEFKMKEVNRRVGGLYSMFVKGGTEGNTLKADPPPADGAGASAPSSSAAGAFSWKKAMRNALRAAPQRQLKVKALRKAVLAEHSKSHPDVDSKEARRSFKERLKKDDNIVKEGKVLRLK